MLLKIITGTAKCKKSDTVARLAAENDGLLIVPETHSLSAEKDLLKYTPALGFGKAEVLSFRRLAHRFGLRAARQKHDRPGREGHGARAHLPAEHKKLPFFHPFGNQDRVFEKAFITHKRIKAL